MKKIRIVFLIIFFLLICNISFGYDSLNSDNIAKIRINEIRKTGNTDISNRTGRVFYLSSDGDDTNDGLTEESAWKTIEKLNNSLVKKEIKATDTILLRRGDVFRGQIVLRDNDIMIGSYGDETLKKPEVLVSPWDGAKIGEWTEIDTNIWRYTVNGENPFSQDVGLIWLYDKDGNVLYSQKVVTLEDFDETNLDLKTLLDSDLKFYHKGHPYAFNERAEELYMYSETNPKERFSKIEFSVAKCGIKLWNLTNIIIDNVDVKYAGIHGVAGGTVANLKVTNCEFSYIGGAVQKYESNKVTRYGNGIEIYGSVTEKNGYAVEDGYIARNNYVHDIYDAGITFQLTTEEASPVENVVFDNNVIEKCNYNIEYWNNCTSKNEEDQEQTYIKNFEITNNIMRYAGFGVSQTRPDKKQSAHIKTWKHNRDNLVKEKYIIENNIFDSASEHIFYIYAVNNNSLPKMKNNTFYNSLDVPFGYMYFDTKVVIPYDIENLKQLYPQNQFNDLSINLNKGDLDRDGKITINDLAKLKLYLIEKLIFNDEELILADIDRDNNITINDFAILKLIFIGEEK